MHLFGRHSRRSSSVSLIGSDQGPAMGGEGHSMETRTKRKVEDVKAVLHYIDGRIVKGYAQSFDPQSLSLHFKESAEAPSAKLVEIEKEGLKGIFFVKTFVGDPYYSERKEFGESDKLEGRRVKITFVDGEMLEGFTIGDHSQRPGFFLFTPDLESNSFGIYVLSAAVRDFRFL